jgi:hypothetical protein
VNLAPWSFSFTPHLSPPSPSLAIPHPPPPPQPRSITRPLEPGSSGRASGVRGRSSLHTTDQGELSAFHARMRDAAERGRRLEEEQEAAARERETAEREEQQRLQREQEEEEKKKKGLLGKLFKR